MLANVSFEEVIQAFGHDGSELLCPNDHRGFPTPEVIDVALTTFNFHLATFPFRPAIVSKIGMEHLVYPNGDENHRINWLLSKGSGLITGCYAVDKHHMVAWDGKQIYDPHGRIYDLDDPNCIILDEFLLRIPCTPLL